MQAIETRITRIVTNPTVAALCEGRNRVLDLTAVIDRRYSKHSCKFVKFVSQRISTSAIIAFCKARRSASNSSGVVVDLTWCGRLISTRTLANGCGTMNRSQLPSRQQREYSRFTGTTGAPDFC